VALTAATAVVGILSALTTPAAVRDIEQAFKDGTAYTGSMAANATSLLQIALAIASYVVVALWMMRVYKNLTTRGQKPSAPATMEWWGWFIPVANFILPFWSMKAIARKRVSMGALLGWWVAWCLFWITFVYAAVVQSGMTDLATGKILSLDGIDTVVPTTWASAVVLVIAWVFLQHIVRKVTERHLTD